MQKNKVRTFDIKHIILFVLLVNDASNILPVNAMIFAQIHKDCTVFHVLNDFLFRHNNRYFQDQYMFKSCRQWKFNYAAKVM